MQGNLKQALEYSAKNPSSDFAVQLATMIKSGKLDGEAQKLGVDLSPIKSSALGQSQQSNVDDLSKPLPMPFSPSYGPRVGEEQAAGAKKIGRSVEQGATAINQAGEQLAQNKPFSALATTAKGVAQAGFGTIAGATEMAFAPITPWLQDVTSRLAKQNPEASKVFNENVAPKINEFVQKHPEATELTGDILNTLLLAVGGKSVAEPLEGAFTKESFKTAVGSGKEIVSDITKMPSSVAPVVKKVIEKIPKKNVDVEELTAKILQADKSEVQRALEGLKQLDTTGVKSSEDLVKVSNERISNLSQLQDAYLDQDKTLRKVQQLTTNVNGVAHNYVLDALKQLKDYYKATNDIANLGKIDSYLERLDPVKGTGLTRGEVNQIARMHGTDLNAYNANNELASGLKKQAAENTRQGLKATVRKDYGSLSQKIDENISSLYTVRNLAQEMADATNKYLRKLENPNILQKVGSFVGKTAKITGVKDFIRELGLPGVASSKSLSPIEIEGLISKRLKELNKAISKDDTGFAKDIAEIIKSKNIKPVNNIPTNNAVKKVTSQKITTQADPLITEAKKYKTAEEFVKAQQLISHYTSQKFNKFDLSKTEANSVWFTDNPKIDLKTGQGLGSSQVGTGGAKYKMDRYINPKSKIIDIEKSDLTDKYTTGQLIDMGYSGVKVPQTDGSNWYQIWEPNKDLMTKSQLTDIWNKANKK